MFKLVAALLTTSGLIGGVLGVTLPAAQTANGFAVEPVPAAVAVGAADNGLPSQSDLGQLSQEAGQEVNLPELFRRTRSAIVEVLQEAGKEFGDRELAGYYKKLVDGYGINEPPPDQEEALPDIKRVTSAAITLPLQEAGKQFTDKDLAGFYHKLLDDSGWNISPN